MDFSYLFNNSPCKPSLIHSLTLPPPQPNSSEWTLEEKKIFENSVSELDLESSNLFEKIALRIPRKSVNQIQQHFNELMEDVYMIESGIPLPNYNGTNALKGKISAALIVENKSCHPQPRKKEVPWTEREHELFLMGLEKYGKGDWRSISRHFVVTRTPTQVASHAQKYFLKVAQNDSRPKKHSASKDASIATVMNEVEHNEWTFEENKLFENSIAEFDLDSPDLFKNISMRVPRKTIEQIKKHYEALIEDVEMIEWGKIPLPSC